MTDCPPTGRTPRGAASSSWRQIIANGLSSTACGQVVHRSTCPIVEDGPLFWAAFNGHADIVSSLLGRGSSPDARNEDGEWPLLCSVYNGRTSVVRHLLVGGAKRNQLDAEGQDELWLAQTSGRQDIVAILEGPRARHTNRHVRKSPNETM